VAASGDAVLEIIGDGPVGDAELRLKLNPVGAGELAISLRYARDSGHDHLMTEAWGGWWELSVEPGREAFTYNIATLWYRGPRPPPEVSLDVLVSAAADERGGALFAFEASSPVGDATLEINFDDEGLERLLTGVADAVRSSEARVTLDQPKAPKYGRPGTRNSLSASHATFGRSRWRPSRLAAP
jgi:hypothetical protein